MDPCKIMLTDVELVVVVKKFAKPPLLIDWKGTFWKVSKSDRATTSVTVGSNGTSRTPKSDSARLAIPTPPFPAIIEVYIARNGKFSLGIGRRKKTLKGLLWLQRC